MDAYTTTNTTVVTYNNWLTAPVMIFWLALIVLSVVALWKVFTKAGEEGWKSLIPFYNTYTLFRIAGRNGWWFLAMFVPIVNFVVLVMLALDLAKHFAKSAVFAIFGLLLFPLVGYMMLAFGEAKYVGPKHD